MKWLNVYVSFASICFLKAIMDVMNFRMEPNTGFYSITLGWFDMWHIAWWIILLIIALKSWNKKDTRKLNVLKLVALAGIALAVQLLIYNGLFEIL